ncbi:MAG: T9SS type A sorting domain-containing protein [Flavobacteriales bacterium]
MKQRSTLANGRGPKPWLKRTLPALFAAALLSVQQVSASHIVGSEILWECMGNNQYRITLNLFRDCAGIVPNTQESITFDSPCGQQSLTVNNTSITEVSQLCAAELPNSSCNGGSLPGVAQWVYSGLITLPPCDTWTMTWSQCCRNGAIVNLVDPSSLSFQLESTLNNAGSSCDDSPVFNNAPIPYVCVNQPVSYSFGVSDQDGDLLSYEFVSAMQSGGTPVPYQSGYTFGAPIPGITLNPSSGLITFTPTLLGNFVVTFKVVEHDNLNNVIGSVTRDMQFVVIPCTNQPPDPNAGAITNLSGTALQTESYSLDMCETDQFCFDLAISDPDATDGLTLTSNVGAVLPGATFSSSGTNPATGTVCWTGTAGSSGFYSFIVTATDDACPQSAFQTYVYSVTVQSCGDTCQLRTQTMGGWGARPNGNNPAAYLHANFASAFPFGLTVGGTCGNGRTLVLTNAQAVTDFLPSAGTPAKLPPGSLVDPTGYGNTLAGQLVATTLSVAFDAADPDFGSSSALLGETYVAQGVFLGMSVDFILGLANAKIGNCGGPYSLKQLNKVLNSINKNFVDGTTNNGFLSCEKKENEEDRLMTTTDGATDELLAYPNPANDKLMVRTLTVADGQVTVRLMDITGRAVVTGVTYSAVAGELRESALDVSGLQSGVYVLRVERDGYAMIETIVVD